MTDQVRHETVRVICDTCAYVYRTSPDKIGKSDGGCSAKVAGTLRELTAAEEILLKRNAELTSFFNGRGDLLNDLYEQAMAKGLQVVHDGNKIYLTESAQSETSSGA